MIPLALEQLASVVGSELVHATDAHRRVDAVTIDSRSAAGGLLALGAWVREVVDPVVVGVTGSNGKTTTKDLIAATVGACRATGASAGSYNRLLVRVRGWIGPVRAAQACSARPSCRFPPPTQETDSQPPTRKTSGDTFPQIRRKTAGHTSGRASARHTRAMATPQARAQIGSATGDGSPAGKAVSAPWRRDPRREAACPLPRLVCSRLVGGSGAEVGSGLGDAGRLILLGCPRPPTDTQEDPYNHEFGVPLTLCRLGLSSAVLNADDHRVAAMAAHAPGRVVTYGRGADADWRAEDGVCLPVCVEHPRNMLRGCSTQLPPIRTPPPPRSTTRWAGVKRRLRPSDAVLIKASRPAGLERVADGLLSQGAHRQGAHRL